MLTVPNTGFTRYDYTMLWFYRTRMGIGSMRFSIEYFRKHYTSTFDLAILSQGSCQRFEIKILSRPMYRTYYVMRCSRESIKG